MYKILDIMNIKAGLGEYILQTHNTNFFEDSKPPSGYASVLWVISTIAMYYYSSITLYRSVE